MKPAGDLQQIAERAITDITHPGIIQKILVYIEAQSAPLQ
jgi:hypothetical protein